MNGTWQTTGGGGGKVIGLVAAAVAAAVIAESIAALLATLLMILLITAAVVVVAAVAGVVLLRKRFNPDYSPALAEQAAAYRAAVAAPKSPTVIEHHYHQHLHLAPGATAEGIKWPAVPLRDAVNREE